MPDPYRCSAYQGYPRRSLGGRFSSTPRSPPPGTCLSTCGNPRTFTLSAPGDPAGPGACVRRPRVVGLGEDAPQGRPEVWTGRRCRCGSRSAGGPGPSEHFHLAVTDGAAPLLRCRAAGLPGPAGWTVGPACGSRRAVPPTTRAAPGRAERGTSARGCSPRSLPLVPLFFSLPYMSAALACSTIFRRLRTIGHRARPDAGPVASPGARYRRRRRTLRHSIRTFWLHCPGLP